MKGRIVIDGNAFYEIDEECMRKKKEKEAREARELLEKQRLNKQRPRYK